MKGLFASLEEMGVEVEGTNVDVEVEVQPVVHADELETALLEGNEIAEEAENQTVAIDTAEEVAESLESMIESLESALAKGGMDTTAASMYRFAMEQYHERLGVKYEPSASLESFDGIATKSSATVVSLEEAKSLRTKVWDAIMKAIDWVIDLAKRFYKWLFDSHGKFIKRCEEVADRGRNAKVDESVKITDKRIAKALQVEGSFVSATEAVGIIEATMSQLNNSNATAIIAKELGKVTDMEDGKQALEALSGILKSITPKWGEQLKEEDFKKAANLSERMSNVASKKGFNMEVFTAKGVYLPGNVLVYQMVNTSAAEIRARTSGGVDGVTYYRGGVSKLKVKDAEKEVKPLAANEIVTVANDLKKIAVEGKKIADKLNSLEKDKKELKRKVFELSKKAAKQATDKTYDKPLTKMDEVGHAALTWANNYVVKKCFNNLITSMDQPYMAFLQYFYSEGKVLLDYAEKSMGKATADAKEDNKAAPAAA